MQWKQLPGESGQAYAAFKTYLDLGPIRSCDAAYKAQGGPQVGRKGATRAPGSWRRWFTRHQWQKRARAYDQRDHAAADQSHVEAIQATVTKAVRDDWEQGRIARMRQQEQEEWELRNLLLKKAREMLGFGLLRQVTKQTPKGDVVVVQPVDWDFSTTVNLIKLIHQLGRASAQMPLKVAEPAADESFKDSMFATSGQLADAMPDGAMPDMPLNPAAKPQLGASIIATSDKGLRQPEKVRPRK
jgi:hypothetical protein